MGIIASNVFTITSIDELTILDQDVFYILSEDGQNHPLENNPSWSHNVPELLPGNYLWTMTQVTYSDGSVVTSFNVTYISKDGSVGNSSHVFIRYLDVEPKLATNSMMTESPTDNTLYVGIATISIDTNNEVPSAPQDISSYQWSKFRDESINVKIYPKQQKFQNATDVDIELVAVARRGNTVLEDGYCKWYKDDVQIGESDESVTLLNENILWDLNDNNLDDSLPAPIVLTGDGDYEGATVGFKLIYPCAGLKVVTTFKVEYYNGGVMVEDSIDIENTVSILFGDTDPYIERGEDGSEKSTAREGDWWIDTSREHYEYYRWEHGAWSYNPDDPIGNTSKYTVDDFYDYVGTGNGKTTAMYSSRIQETAKKIDLMANVVYFEDGSTIREKYADLAITADGISSTVADLDTYDENNPLNLIKNTRKPSVESVDKYPMLIEQTDSSTGRVLSTAQHGIRTTYNHNETNGYPYFIFGNKNKSGLGGLEAGKTYTLSFKWSQKLYGNVGAESTNTIEGAIVNIYNQNSSPFKTQAFSSIKYTNMDVEGSYVSYGKEFLNYTKERFVCIFTIPSGSTKIYFEIKPSSTTGSLCSYGDFIEVRDLKLEEGSNSNPIWRSAKDENNFISKIDQTADKIDMVVSGDSTSEFKLTDKAMEFIADNIELKADAIDMAGVVTFSDLSGNDTEKTVINGGLITTGKVDASHIDAKSLTVVNDNGTETLNISNDGNITLNVSHLSINSSDVLTGEDLDSRINSVTQEVLPDQIKQTVKEETEDLNGRVNELSTEISHTANDITITFDKKIDDTNEKIDGTSSTVSEMQSYIKFEDGKILLGNSVSGFRLEISNTKLSIMDGNSEVAYFSNNTMYNNAAEIKSVNIIGNSAWQVEPDKSISLVSYVNNNMVDSETDDGLDGTTEIIDAPSDAVISTDSVSGISAVYSRYKDTSNTSYYTHQLKLSIDTNKFGDVRIVNTSGFNKWYNSDGSGSGNVPTANVSSSNNGNILTTDVYVYYATTQYRYFELTMRHWNGNEPDFKITMSNLTYSDTFEYNLKAIKDGDNYVLIPQ